MLGRLMSDETPSTLQERLLALPFAAYLGLGALTGVLAVALASLSVESSSQATVAAARVDGGGVQDGADVAAGSAGSEDTVRAAGAGGKAAAGQAVSADPDEDAHDAEPDAADPAAPEAEGAAADSGVEAGAPDDDAVEIADSPSDVGSANDGAEAEAGTPSSAAEPAVAPPPDPNREAEAAATPEELYDMAKEAYDDGRYKDAYRLATKSQRAKPADRTQLLRGRAACRIKDEQNAKEIVKSFKLGDDRRKTLRTFCKDHGVRVGL